MAQGTDVIGLAQGVVYCLGHRSRYFLDPHLFSFSALLKHGPFLLFSFAYCEPEGQCKSRRAAEKLE
eukprot:scaffold6136_cov18-Tisochrysis_lutea.AAC.2